MHAIQLEATRLGARLLRNTVGFYKENGRAIRYGLGVGSPDLVGWTSTGRFLCVEVKRPGKVPTKEQHQFLESVVRCGGIAFWADSVQTVTERLK